MISPPKKDSGFTCGEREKNILRVACRVGFLDTPKYNRLLTTRTCVLVLFDLQIYVCTCGQVSMYVQVHTEVRDQPQMSFLGYCPSLKQAPSRGPGLACLYLLRTGITSVSQCSRPFFSVGSRDGA